VNDAVVKGRISVSKVITRDIALDVAQQFAARIHDEIDKETKIQERALLQNNVPAK